LLVLTATDCFILDSGNKLYVYHGEGSDGFEKMKATSLAEQMESERGGSAERVDVDDAFWTLLGGTEGDVTTGDSSAHKAPGFTTPKLYSMHDETHEWSLVKEGVITLASTQAIRWLLVMTRSFSERLLVITGGHQE